MSSNRSPNRFRLYDAAALQAARAARGLGPYAARPGTRTADPSVPRCERCDKPRELAEGTEWCDHCLAIIRRREVQRTRSRERKRQLRASGNAVKRRCVVCGGAVTCLRETVQPCHKKCSPYVSNVDAEAAA